MIDKKTIAEAIVFIVSFIKSYFLPSHSQTSPVLSPCPGRSSCRVTSISNLAAGFPNKTEGMRIYLECKNDFAASPGFIYMFRKLLRLTLLPGRKIEIYNYPDIFCPQKTKSFP